MSQSAFSGLGMATRSMEVSPLRKKLSTGRLSVPCSSLIIVHIWNENMSLWRSKMPMHVYS